MTERPRLLAPLLAAGLALAASGAWAQAVALQGMLGGRALLIVDGSQPKAVAPGDSWKGVKVLSTQGDQAVVEAAGKRFSLRVGEAPASVGGGSAPPSSGRIVLTAGSNGHFTTQGGINGRAAYFLVDTGASMVSMGAGDAERFGVDYRSGQPMQLGTANGVVPAWRVKLNAVRVGDVELRDVDAVVGQQSMPFVLLGNSFLTRFQMRRDNDQLVLERRY